MKEILEVKELYDIDVVHDPELDKYNGQNLFPKKLAEAQESIAKYGLPKEWEEERQKWKEEKAFWVKGQFSQADLETLTFLLSVEATDNQPQTTYRIATLTHILNKLVTTYWGRMIHVHIKPSKGKEVQGQYELINVA